MPSCPNCHAEVPDDIGIVVCASCGKSLMMGMDGNVSLAEDHGQSELSVDDSFEGDLASEPDISNQDFGYSQVVEAPEYVENLEVEAQESVASEQQFEQSLEEEEFDEFSTGGELALESGDGAQILDMPETVMQIETAENFQEVVDYGNSDASTWSEGNLKYRIYVSGLDSNDIRKEVKAIMSDPKFQWDINDLFSSVENGELELTGVSPVKASELIKKLRPLSVTVRWEQYVLQQSN